MAFSISDFDLLVPGLARAILLGRESGDALAPGAPEGSARAVLDALVAAGLAEFRAGRTLRTAKAVRLLAVDLGGTKLHAAIIDAGGAILVERREPTDLAGAAAVIAQIGRMHDTLLVDCDLAPGDILGAALGAPGAPDPRTGAIIGAPNIPGLDRLDVGAALAERLGLPVRIENDVNMAALGEHAGKPSVRSLAFVALGTGIGMGLVLDGRLLRGATGLAGEIALLPIGADPLLAANYRHGPLETAIGSGGILAAARRHGDVTATNVEDLFAQARAGAAAAQAAIDDTARTLFTALLAVKAIVDPELVVLGGSIGLQPEIAARLAVLGATHPFAPKVVTSALGPQAVLAGAAHVALGDLIRRHLSEAAGQPAEAALFLT